MEKGQVYLSKINLNEEYGTISEPVTPTVRAASPIFDRNNDLVGILVINVDLISFYRDLERISGREEYAQRDRARRKLVKTFTT